MGFKRTLFKYGVTALAGAVAVTVGPTFIERSARGFATAGEANKFARDTLKEYQRLDKIGKLKLKDKSSYTPIKE